MATGITLTDLYKSYRGGRVKALNGVSAHFLPGRTHGLIGPNGSGKTTVMGCLLGLLYRDSGHIDIDGLSPDDLRFKSQLGYVPERLRFDMWMKGWDFMSYHYRLAQQDPAGHDARIRECLHLVGLEEKAWPERLKSYSRGMLQRIGLAQALLANPRYLFLDEPTSGMDPAGVILFRQIVQAESRKGCLVLLSSHQLNQVEQLCDEVHFINQGQIVSAEMNGMDDTRRILRVRWRQEKGAKGGPKVPAALEKRIVEERPGEASFKIKDDEEAVEVIETLVKKGFPVVEAIPDTSRLERFFVAAKEKTQ